MPITKNKELFLRFEKIYWQYFLELEEQFLSTRRYVAFDKANFKTFSTEYLKLLVAVCSEIDTVGKAIAHQVNADFKEADTNNNVQKWWYIIQDWFQEANMSSVKLLDDMEFSPWVGFRIEQFVNAKGAIRLRLEKDSATPYWWTSYNKVKHTRTLEDPVTQEQYFHRASLGNLCEAFSALYLLEKCYMMSVGRAEDYNRVQKSKLFEKEKPAFYYDEDGDICQAED